MKVTSVKYLLMAQDMDRAIRFWNSSFGFSKRYGDEHWTELDAAGACLALHGGGDGSTRTTELGVEVDDIEAAVVVVAAAGGRVLNPPRYRPGEPIILADVVDTEGTASCSPRPSPEVAHSFDFRVE